LSIEKARWSVLSPYRFWQFHLNSALKRSSATHFGEGFVNGRDIWAQPSKIRDVRFEVGLVFQYPEYQLFEETVSKDIAFGPINMGQSSMEVADRVREAAAYFGFAGRGDGKIAFELSGGQKRSGCHCRGIGDASEGVV
jgi:energy-coupling factor transport system ATP-binding protein